jgi:hypothetical protein
MHRIDSSTVDADLFGTGKDGFTEGDESTGVAATQSTDDWLNAVQEELSNFIEYSADTLLTSGTDTRDQLISASQRITHELALANMNRHEHTATGSLVYGCVWSSTLGLWIAVGSAPGALDAYIGYSFDGETWVEAVNPKTTFDLYGVAETSGTLIAVGEADGTDAYIVKSTNGAAWAEQANPKNFDLNAICASGNEAWVAGGVSDGVDAYVVTGSAPGTTWTERTAGFNGTVWGVCYGNGWDVLVGIDSTTNTIVSTSSTGLGFTQNAGVTGSEILYAVAYSAHHSKFIAVGESDGTEPALLVSDSSNPSSTWTQVSTSGVIGDYDLRTVTVTPDGLVIVAGEAGSTPYFSWDLENWYAIPVTRPDWFTNYDILTGCFSSDARQVLIAGEHPGSNVYFFKSLGMPNLYT